MRHKNEIAPLTGLRAFAAIYVFLFHMSRWPYVDAGFFRNLVYQGAIGMSIFFVLSGFVLAYQYSDQKFDARQYFVNRFARIYPIYVLCALLTSGWMGIPSGGDSILDVARHAMKVAIIVLSNIFLIQGWFPSFFNHWNDGGSWSISVEAFLYLSLPILLPWLVGLTRRRLIAVIVVAYVASLMPGAVYVLWNDTPFPVYYSMPIFRLPEFIIGAATCILVRRGSVFGQKTLMATAAVMIAASASFVGTIGPQLPGYTIHDWIVIPTLATTIVLLASNRGILARIMGSRPIVWLGEISYCIYSLQTLIIMPILRHHDAIVSRFPALSNNVILLIVAAAALITASGICHHFIEEPMRRWIRSRYSNKLMPQNITLV